MQKRLVEIDQAFLFIYVIISNLSPREFLYSPQHNADAHAYV